MKHRISGFGILVSMALAACASSLPISGKMERTNETFGGGVAGSGYRSGSGHLTLVSSLTTCEGDFTYTSRRRGEGVLSCRDGRTGAFHLSGVQDSGSGTGELNGQRFNFVFGSPGA